MPRKYKSPSPSPRHGSKKYKTTPRKRVRSLSRDRNDKNDRSRKIVKKKGYRFILF